MTDEELTAAVKRAVQSIDALAEVYLFGSHARGDARPESDWDFLILLDRPIDSQLQQGIRRQLYEIEWETGEVLTSVIHSREEWNDARFSVMPFHQHVSREGVLL
jgi:predicted nucleotidyltransferase